MTEYHIPVLLNESVEALVRDPDACYVDATFGGGGHSRKILSKLSDKGRLIAFDLDSEALAQAPDDPRLKLIHNNFRFIHNFLLLENIQGVDGVMADLGVSSHQFDTPERGFSLRYDSPLDMRMNSGSDTMAAEILNSYEQSELERIFRLYAEVDNARKLSQLIVEAREKKLILTTSKLNQILSPALPGHAAHKQLARIYQALRIELNKEMRSLEKFLSGALEALNYGGRLVVISYHSLEDRMVKNFMRMPGMKAVNRKPIVPSEEEIAVNTRARSAKLRIAQKVKQA